MTSALQESCITIEFDSYYLDHSHYYSVRFDNFVFTCLGCSPYVKLALRAWPLALVDHFAQDQVLRAFKEYLMLEDQSIPQSHCQQLV